MHRAFKDPLYEQFGRIGHAVASPRRLELLDLLGQGEKTVEDLAAHAAMPVKSASAHLRILRQARLVETPRSDRMLTSPDRGLTVDPKEARRLRYKGQRKEKRPAGPGV